MPMARGPSRMILSEWLRLRLSSLSPESRDASDSRAMRFSSSGVSSGSFCSLVFVGLDIRSLCTSWRARRRLLVQKSAGSGRSASSGHVRHVLNVLFVLSCPDRSDDALDSLVAVPAISRLFLAGAADLVAEPVPLFVAARLMSGFQPVFDSSHE